jgi:muramidase (phage lysozyme)
MTPNLQAFLDALAYSEIGPALLAVSDNGYNVLVGSTPAHPLLFHNYADHPNVFNAETNSDAAGRYQIMHRIWLAYKAQLNLPNFEPDSQDKIALQLIKECHALADIEAGNFAAAITKCRSRWASLPGAGYGQHEQKLADLQAAYVAAGGSVA